MGFPKESTHYRHWIFQSPEHLVAIREQARAEAQLEALGATLDADLERLCVQFCGQGLLDICREKNMSYAITSSAVAFYSRFFLKRSAILYDPRKVLFTCILLAAKSQDPSLPLRMKSLLAGVNGGVSIKEICHLEIPLLDALDFHLFVLDTRTPMQNLCNEWFRQAKSGLSGDDVKKVNEQFGKLTQAAEQLALQLHMTDIHFLFTPTQVALAVFLHVFADFVSSEEDFYQIIFRSDLACVPKIREAVHRASVLLVDFTFRDKAAEGEKATKAVKAVNGLHRKLRKKRKLAEEETPVPKRQKVEGDVKVKLEPEVKEEKSLDEHNA